MSAICCFYRIFNFWVFIDTIMQNICLVFFGPDSILGVLTTLNFIGACSSKLYLIFVDPKSKISEKSDKNCDNLINLAVDSKNPFTYKRKSYPRNLQWCALENQQSPSY